MFPFELSENLSHTWFVDLDGTILKHNGLWEDGYDTLLPGVKELWNSIPMDDTIVITTARRAMYREQTEEFLKTNNISYDYILFGIAHGERIVINDIKPERALKTAIAWNVERNLGFQK